ncbi:hypothetical protein NC653_017637 [Populus alba x Populus x berolinensis]|uniref:Uncharacterized protein n=1 Tax=Populus alba x Populus x berolinensis TaxID=444605 RepID=A0AAD6QR79_9ROSI|nr:hypothetical protein NC653_017637 [Populus alba x Populus x berolinensis]
MGLDKSPNPNGLNMKSYQQFWDLIRAYITNACRGWLASKTFPLSLVETLVVLILKVENHNQ